MYHRALQQVSKTLRNLGMVLDKAERHAAAKKFDSGNFLTQRLAPDMFPLARQVQMACDVAKSVAAILSNREVPRHEDTEKTVAELKQRINVTVAFVESVKEGDVAHLNDKSKVALAFPKGKGMLAQDALLQRALPNFFFHVTTAYGLLRQGGVEIGKMDYLGELAMFDV